MLRTRCEAFVADAGRVVGVKISDETASELFIKANRGVILTAGGMGMNLDLLEKYVPSAYMYATQGGPMPTHTGETIRMSLGMGADISGFDSFSCWEGGLDEYWGDGDGSYWHHFWHGPSQLAQNPWLRIDKVGNRLPYYLSSFSPEGFGVLQPGYDLPVFGMGDLSTANAAMSSIGHRAHCIFDSNYPEIVYKLQPSVSLSGSDTSRTPLTAGFNIAEGTDPSPYASLDWQAEVEEAIERGSVKKADTLADLAAPLKIDPDALITAGERWNELCQQGEDTDLSIPYLSEWLLPIENPPYYGITEGGHLSKTLAGLRVNAKMQVIDREAKPIPGLFAGWTTAGGLSGEASFGGQVGNSTIFGAIGASGIGGFMAIKGLLASE
jgi:hypothetical protein